ncbi:PAS domain-containing protein [Hymenobacter canadensis]|uniref:histidine kinase n=1 Tax=Hymenobacter canadensis TaxID=2999067 RepID=A0ABY7LWI2_9BACT|nr:PAS domain-containing protein [Hymenobacter canadensis]WBA43959.1 PAS domain-containing protein [Hymenobacter canadensis]
MKRASSPPPAGATSPRAQQRIAELERELRQARTAEAEARTAEATATQRLHSLAGYQREGLLLLDEHLRVSLINDQYCHLLELPLPARQWLGVSMATLVNMVVERVADPAGYFAELAQAREFPVPQLNGLLPLHSGRVLEHDIVAVETGAGTGWLLSCRDVTALRQGEEQLRRVSRLPEENPTPTPPPPAPALDPLLAQVADHLPDGLLLVDADDQVLLLNARYCALWNLPPDQDPQWWRGRPVAELRAAAYPLLMNPAEQGRQREQLRAAGQPCYRSLMPLTDGRVLEIDYVPLPAGTLIYARDVTAREQALRELRDISSIPQQNPNPIVRFGAGGERLFANEAADTLRTALPAAEAADLAARLHALADAALREQQVQEQELPAGGRHFQVVAWPVPAQQYVNLYLVDISIRYRAEEQLQEQRTFYETVLNTMPSQMVVLDPRGRYLFLNAQTVPDAAARRALLGCTPAELAAHLRWPAAVAERRAGYFRQVTQEGRPQIWQETTTDVATDQPRHFLRQYQPVLDEAGQLRFVIGYGTDITARVAAEDAVQASEARLREQQAFTQRLLDTTQSVVYVRDQEGRFHFTNQAMRTLQAQLGSIDDLPPAGQQLRTDELASYAALDARVLATGQTLPTEDRLTLADGTVRWFYTVKSPLAFGPDAAPQVLGVSTDITALKAAQVAAEAATTARENFLANMSHEIRTPMNGVLGMAALLAKTRLTAQQQEFVQTISSSGTHLLGVLNDVLDVAKINSSKLELEQFAFNLCDSVEQAVMPLALQAQAQGLTFHVEPLTADRPWVLSDPFRLNQVLLNLLTNALKFTPHGSITLRGALLAETDEVFTMRFEVQDTGIGIGPEALTRIFESFTQANADTTRRFGGTGLGLTISRALVAQLGGELTVTSTLGVGSTFGFTLPLRKAPIPAGQTADAFDTGQLRGTRVLLAEDNPTNRAVARLHLLQWGMVVDEAVDGPATLHQLETQGYDLVLMDIQMPGMNGVDVTRRLRQLPDPVRANTPVLALTANAFRDENEKYLAAGLNDYLAKPFAEETLYAKLVALLPPPGVPVAPRPYDLTRLREEAHGHPAYVAVMVNSFLEHMPPRLHELQAAGRTRDWTRVAELLHHIKPNLLMLAVAGATGPMNLLETALEMPADPAQETARLVALQQLVAAVETALRELPAESGLLAPS